MAKGLIDLLFDSVFDASWTGKYGKMLTEQELLLVRILGRRGKVLRNVYLPKDDGGTSEIDVLFITQKGIFVFESKNYSGWIFGDEKSKSWTVSLPNRQKNRFYNKVKYQSVDIKGDHPDEKTLRLLHKKSGLPLKKFFNTSGMLYRDMGLSKKLPTMTYDDMYKLLASDGMLVKRPLLITDKAVIPGFGEETWKEALR